MSLLTAALQSSLLIVTIYSALIMLLALTARKRGQIVALALINHAGLFGLAALLAIPVISPFHTNYLTLSLAILAELFCVYIFFLSGIGVVNFLKSRASAISDRQVVILFVAKALFFAINYFAAGGQYGIFSDDSRIDFLVTSPTLSKTRYLDGLIDFIILLGVGIRYTSLKRIRLRDLSIILAINGFGLLTGSKGSTLLLTVYVMLFVYAAFPLAFSSKVKLNIICFFSALVFGYVYILSDILEVTIEALINLSLARFILSADARLMAFDPNISQYVLSQPHGALLAELFRGPAKMLGIPVAEFSIGVYQFQAELGTTNYVGSTGQLIALLVTYGDDFWLGEFIVVASLALFTYKLFSTSLKSRAPGLAWLSAASLYQLSATLAQGYEAYVQLLPICIVVIMLFWGSNIMMQKKRIHV
ncbi:MAG: hypothetical protein WCB36_08160 [Burkholderiales bacterium]